MESLLHTPLESSLEDDEVQTVLKSGIDLREYSKKIEDQLKTEENKSIQNYIKESLNIVSLHTQIAACDDILERMESMLLGFQSDLGSISCEIVNLQRKSIKMSQQLHNRQAVRGQLSQFIDDITVTESLIMGILDNHATDKEFIAQLIVLSHKIKFVEEQNTKGVKCCQDVREILEKLKVKAVTKIRQYLLDQISKFRRPMTNYQVPQSSMLKNKAFFEFVLENERFVAQEICSEYVDTMGKIYFSYFKSYSQLLNKLMYEEQATKDDLMGVEESGQKSTLFHKPSLKNKNTVFTIGQRGEVLTSLLEAPIIIPHSAQKTEIKHPYESLFRSEQYALVDNACREYLFISEFFMLKGSRAMEVFNQIMGKTLNMLVKNLESFVNTSYDTIALFLCAQLVLRYQIICHKRAVPALDVYWDTLQEILWPRLKFVFELNIHSVKECDPGKLMKAETKTHYITRRYAEFSGAIVDINETFPNDLVSSLLSRLLEEVHLFILRMAGVFPQRMSQLIFLINNYDTALSILSERVKENCKETESFRDKFKSRVSDYVEEVLSPYFGGVMQFVKEGEILVEKGQTEELKKLQEKSLVLVKLFSDNWKQSLERLNKEVLSSFPNLLTGSSLLQLALAQMVQYYERFSKLLPAAHRTHLVNIHHIRVELKKYKSNFS